MRWVRSLAILAALALGMIGVLAPIRYAWTYGNIPGHVRTVRYTVKVADTPWGIAQRDPSFGTGQVQDWIVRRYGYDLQPGEVILVPVK